MEYTTILLWILFLWVFFQVFISARKIFAGKLPPGPFPLPIIGSLFKLGDKPHKSLAQLAKVHGSLMTIKLGSVTTIVVSSASMAKEVLQTNDLQFSGRTVPDAARILNYHEASLVWSHYSLHWRNLRKLCASQMFTTQRLNENEGIRLMKVKDLINFIRHSSKSRHAVNIGQAIFSTTLNIISNIMFSVDLAQFNSETAQDFKTVVWGILEEVARPNLADYFPLLRPFDPQGVRRCTASYFEKLDNLFDTLIDQRMQFNKEQNVSKDLLDTLLQYTQENGSKLRRLDIISLLKDLFIAGTDTSAGTLEWAMTELLRNPDILAKARLELTETINKDKLIEESDIGRLPYLQAVVKETLRLHPPAPLLVPHRAETDVEICGFSVPRHAQVLVNAWAIGRDPETWINPTAFLPDRFLGSKVDFRVSDIGKGAYRSKASSNELVMRYSNVVRVNIACNIM
ncbi:Cytochrome p450 [Thalictrum thalictroides]|uniref:Cytochrome p450 n=1 Tax=Thalictrum thalictroides TaxID=46969 RepID=A0A7J6V083_THATH|nr:Cytochrome p450 [Thalictrum thalictroides]